MGGIFGVPWLTPMMLSWAAGIIVDIVKAIIAQLPQNKDPKFAAILADIEQVFSDLITNMPTLPGDWQKLVQAFKGHLDTAGIQTPPLPPATA